jgi:hypothetical protein
MPIMKTIIIILLTLSSFMNFYGQNLSEIKYRFAKDIFKSDQYKKCNYDRFTEKIDLIDSVTDSFSDTILTSYTYQFGDKTINVRNVSPDLRLIFENGIFNPNVIFGNVTTKISKADFDNLNTTQKIFFNLTRNDSLTISGLEKLEKLNPNLKTKRFKFWVWRIGSANPTEYYIEFYNDKATKETNFIEFIENSKMSFYYKGTVII